jgi:hypothetical protein
VGAPELPKKVLPRYVEAQLTLAEIVNRGKTRVVIDISIWVHKAIARACIELFEGRKTSAWVVVRAFFREQFENLRRNGIAHADFVFDRCPLPAKAAEEGRRNERRDAARERHQREKNVLLPNHLLTLLKLYSSACANAVSREEWLEKNLCELINGAQVVDLVMTWERALFKADAKIAHLLRRGFMTSRSRRTRTLLFTVLSLLLSS